MLTTRMHNPPHLGEILTDTVLGEDGGMTLTRSVARAEE
jgi:hypothetical protein